MAESVTDWLLKRMADGLGESRQYLVLAALEGDEALDDQLEGATTAPAELKRVDEPEPMRAFLKSITVEGFRGIGRKTRLDLHPGPGLIVVAGRNGCGKSSFAEALEVALTGETYRWKKASKQWAGTWRNLHHASASISVEIVAEGQGLTSVGTEWPAGAELNDRSSWVQQPGQRREHDLGPLGWTTPLEVYRPILSYDELGGLLEDEPSKLHDALERILGLEQLNDAINRLQTRSSIFGEPKKQAAAKRKELREALAAANDERARAALTQLSKTRPSIAEVAALLAGGSTDEASGAALLRAVTRLRVPDEAETAAAAADLLARREEFDAAAHDQAGVEATVADLLQKTIQLRDEHGVDECPVCGQGVLNDEWRAAAAGRLADRQDAVNRRTQAELALKSARAGALQLIDPVPQPLRSGVPGVDVAAATDAWQAWATPPKDDAELAEHLVNRLPTLRSELEKVQLAAAAALAERDDEWLSVAPALTAWVGLATEADAKAELLGDVDAAKTWLKNNAEALRNERLLPLADKARKIWARLRQESNVDLGKIHLSGSKTRRRVDVFAQVDGVDTGALSVMSQGELHALALALFLPRATVSASPFRFIVLDDPIQAMDPAKIDGFVSVLAELGDERQVIVLSHDDRLPEAIRRLSVDARLIEIVRGTDSTVTVRSNLDPAARYLRDAKTIASNRDLADTVKREVLPTLLRLAVEAKSREVFYASEFSEGRSRDEVEELWQSRPKTSSRLALALFGDEAQPDSGARPLDKWLTKPYRKQALGAVTTGAHEGLRGDPVVTYENVERLVKDIRRTR